MLVYLVLDFQAKPITGLFRLLMLVCVHQDGVTVSRLRFNLL